MTERTENYGLTLWGAEDKVEREGVNGNFEAVDRAVAGLVVTGSYAGDNATTRTIELGFAPRAVLVENKWGVRSNQTGYAFGGLAVTGGGLNDTTVALSETGFRVRNDGFYHYGNQSGYVYYYMAVV